MKKLKLSLGNVEQILTREQLKHIVGGSGSGSENCYSTSDCTAFYGMDSYCYGGYCHGGTAPPVGTGCNCPTFWRCLSPASGICVPEGG